LPLRELGRLGFEQADRRLAGEEPAPRLLDTEVVLRGSTGVPASIGVPAAARSAAPQATSAATAARSTAPAE
ncbi:MAG TPA: hypothetical protein VFP22_09465, partial [Candidatus Limnocylindrales bacterium]|nr:hypothetical protein [Candidatus Limnocylindrales bacterium]